MVGIRSLLFACISPSKILEDAARLRRIEREHVACRFHVPQMNARRVAQEALAAFCREFACKQPTRGVFYVAPLTGNVLFWTILPASEPVTQRTL
eukprot:scaffold2028_cov353-Pavlova_lutheri.AAC.12